MAYDSEKKREAVTMVRNGASWAAVIKKIGCQRATLARWLKDVPKEGAPEYLFINVRKDYFDRMVREYIKERLKV